MDTLSIGFRIKVAREAKNLTQENLAALIDMSSTYISAIERGVKLPKLDTFVSIANALDVSADTLLFDVVNRSTNEKASLLSRKINHLSGNEQKKILNVLDALLE